MNKETMKHKRFFMLVLSALVLWVSTVSAELPFTVRTLYFQTQGAPDRTVEIRKLMADVHRFFGREMERTGWGFKPFRIEKDANDEIVVHRIRGKHPAAHYKTFNKTSNAISPELPNAFKNRNNIHVIFMGGHQHVNRTLAGIGVVFSGNTIGGYAIIPAQRMVFRTVVHELGHAFGLRHNVSPEADFVMGLNPGHAGFSRHETRWLNKSHYFNPNNRDINFVPRVAKVHPIEVVAPRMIEIQMDMESPNGVYQAEMSRVLDGAGLDWTILDGTVRDTAIFEFDVLTLGGESRAWIQVMDLHGNFSMKIMDFDIPPAAFDRPAPPPKEPWTFRDIDKQALHPEEPEPEAPEPEAPKTEPVSKDDTPRNIVPVRKILTLWSKLKMD